VKVEEIGGERDGDFMENSSLVMGYFLTLLIDTTERGDRG
jgi:hypothetical protein